MEHSLEIQLPFLQVALGSFALVPVVMGNRSREIEAATALGGAIAAAVRGKRVLIVASTDLSHFHERADLERLDGEARALIEAFDPAAFLGALAHGEAEACGGLPVAAVMIACRELGADAARVLAMASSGDVSGDYDGAVGYLAAVITRPEEAPDAEKESAEAADGQPEVGITLGLTEQEQLTLREVVERTLDEVVHGRPVPRFTDTSGHLGEHWGAFVTLTLGGELRGCIGNIVGTRPLIETVAEMTGAAARKDPRFPPVGPAERDALDYEISVLTPVEPVRDIRDIVVGRDGLIVRKGWRSGLLLPQVATEYGWDRETFLAHTCQKAGLPPDAWKDADTIIEKFSAQLF